MPCNVAIARWGQIDPLAEKYYSWSGYNYVMGNPVVLVDPRGDTIKLVNSGEILIYTPGMEYNGDNEFFRSQISKLENLAEAESGLEVLEALSESESSFYLLDRGKDSGGEIAGSFEAFAGGGGIIWLPGNASVSDAAHEIFHAYQFFQIKYYL